MKIFSISSSLFLPLFYIGRQGHDYEGLHNHFLWSLHQMNYVNLLLHFFRQKDKNYYNFSFSRIFHIYQVFLFICRPNFASRIVEESLGNGGFTRPYQSIASQVLYGKWNDLPKKVQHYVQDNVKLCKPDTIHICDGSDRENEMLLYILQRDGMIKPLPKMDNWWECLPKW